MKTKLLVKSLLIAGLLAVMCGYPLQASAITFTFQEQSGFLVGAGQLRSDDPASHFNDIKWYQYTLAPGYVAPPSGEYNTLAWGGNQTIIDNNHGRDLGLDTPPVNPWGNSTYSALQVLGQAGNVLTDGSWVTITELSHQNNSIAASYYTLTDATISSVLNIGSSVSDPNSIPITFNETMNTPPCDPTGNGGLACPDYFGFNAYGSTDGSDTGFRPLTFWYGNQQYEVSFQLVAGNDTTIDYLGTGVEQADVRIWTHEGATSHAYVQMEISPIPEPATLTLLGLGLLGLGLGVAKRRRKNG